MYRSVISLGLTMVMLFAICVSPVSAALQAGIKSGDPSISSKAASAFCKSVTGIPTAECTALEALYNSTNGPGWTNHTGWMETNTPCSWYGVTCIGGYVSQLVLYTNQLTGNIPPNLSNLTHLTQLHLYDNQLTGNIPPELGSLTSLTQLSLFSNQLTGNIPPALGSLANLQYLFLDYNQLTGTIPSVLGNLTNLTRLGLDSNQLTGTIPPTLGNLSNMERLFLGGNLLNGPIPPELASLTKLYRLELGNNQLTGSIPAWMGNFSSMWMLNLGGNQLDGSIPPELGNLIDLFYLRVDFNHLTGSIPPSLGQLSNLGTLNLSYNQLVGSIPAELGNLNSLWELHLESNQLTGSIPAEFGNLTYMRYADIRNNQFYGSLPPELGNLTNLETFSLSANQFTGSIPPELGNMTNLQGIGLQDNQLTGTIPPELGSMANLQGLILSGNQLSGSIPAALGNLSNLVSLYLSGNRLSGSIPAELGNLTHLQYFNLDNNQLGGEIPASLTNLIALIQDGQKTNFGFNMLVSTDPSVIAFLNTKDPDWANTQTVTPTGLHAMGAVGTVQLTWTPIPYIQDGGGYEIGYSTSESGPFSVHGTTSSKSATTYLVDGLVPGTPYFFRLRTNTPTHAGQQNDLWSEYSSSVSATPLYAPPEADFSASPTSGIMPLDVTFANTSAGVYHSCAWTFGDGGTSTSCNPLHTYPNTGIYPVSLRVAGPGGDDTLTRKGYIAVGTQADVTPESGGLLTYIDIAGAQTEVQVPPNAVNTSIKLKFIPAATSTTPPNLGFAGHAFDLSAYQNGDKLDSFVFQAPVTIIIHYTDQDVLNVDENELTLNYWDGSTSQWADAASTCTPASSYSRHPDENWLSVPVCHLSQFSLFGSSQYQLFLPLVIR